MGWGVHDYPGPPPEKANPVCPVCGCECEKFYLSLNREIIGCNECIEEVDAYEYAEEKHSEYMEELRRYQ